MLVCKISNVSKFVCMFLFMWLLEVFVSILLIRYFSASIDAYLLQCIVVCCSGLQCLVMCCITLQYVAVCRISSFDS